MSNFWSIRLFYILALLVIACQSQGVEHNKTFSDGKWIDLSHSFDSQTPYWPTADGFRLDTVFVGMTEGGYYYSAYAFSGAEHGGTHIDAPIHFAEGKQSVDEISLEKLTGEAIVVDVSDSVSAYIDYQVGVDDFKRWEEQWGQIPDDVIILIHTGFARFWSDRKRYLGTDQRGPSAVALLHFPGLASEAAQWLLDKRSIKAIGLDTPSIDYGRSSDFKSHRILFAENIPAFENLANLDRLPSHGLYIVALPMKIKGGSGGPLRIAAFIPD